MSSKDSKKKKEKTSIITPVFRVSFPVLKEAKAAFKGNEPKFSVQMLFPNVMKDEKDIKAMKELKSACIKAAKEKFGDDKADWPENFRSPFSPGEKKNMEAYNGMTVAEARSKYQPQMFNGAKEDIDAEEIYAGCYAKAMVSVFAYSNGANHGVSLGLEAIQKVRNGEKLTGRSNSKDAFDDIEDLDMDLDKPKGKSDEEEIDDMDF